MASRLVRLSSSKITLAPLTADAPKNAISPNAAPPPAPAAGDSAISLTFIRSAN
ncbi:MAG: hypothetical protein QM754_11535 [Tepidisphaeraceae bacterium]